jgi:hypothetical protein
VAITSVFGQAALVDSKFVEPLKFVKELFTNTPLHASVISRIQNEHTMPGSLGRRIAVRSYITSLRFVDRYATPVSSRD